MKKKAVKPEKKSTLIVWNIDQYKTALAKSEAAKLPFTQYVREIAAGAPIKISRSLPLADRRLLATMIGSMNDAGARLIAIKDELELGDVPLESPITIALYETDRVSLAVDQVLARLQSAAEKLLAELERA